MYYLNEITQLEELINKVSAERFELRKSNDLKVQEIFDNVFNVFRELTIKVCGDSASFHLEDGDRNKEIFSINFYERYRGDAELSLSYYSTNTNSEFELNRLVFLGRAAGIVKSNSERILKDISDARKSDLERENELYRIQDGYEKEKRSYQKANDERRKTEIELSLRGEGVIFDKEVWFGFKRNYTNRIKSIKILEVSKSGKTCTVEYVTVGGSTGKEERCDVESVIAQVVSNSKNIVEALFPQ